MLLTQVTTSSAGNGAEESVQQSHTKDAKLSAVIIERASLTSKSQQGPEYHLWKTPSFEHQIFKFQITFFGIVIYVS